MLKLGSCLPAHINITGDQGCGVGSPVIRLRLQLLAISIVRLRLQLRLRLRTDSGPTPTFSCI